MKFIILALVILLGGGGGDVDLTDIYRHTGGHVDVDACVPGCGLVGEGHGGNGVALGSLGHAIAVHDAKQNRFLRHINVLLVNPCIKGHGVNRAPFNKLK